MRNRVAAILHYGLALMATGLSLKSQHVSASGLAEIELEYRRERQHAGIAVAKTQGIYRGRQKGTTKSKPTRAAQLRKQGLTIPEIVNALAVSERTVFRYLTQVPRSCFQPST